MCAAIEVDDFSRLPAVVLRLPWTVTQLPNKFGQESPAIPDLSWLARQVVLTFERHAVRRTGVKIGQLGQFITQAMVPPLFACGVSIVKIAPGAESVCFPARPTATQDGETGNQI